MVPYRSGQNADKGREGVKNPVNFANVLYEWSLTQIPLTNFEFCFQGLTKLTLHVCEEGLRLTEEAAHRLNKPVSTWCLLLDLEVIKAN